MLAELKRSVLLVDDDLSILRVIKRILERKGYTVTAVSNGKDALIQISQNCFDASIVDVRLADISGLEIVKRLNQVSPRTIRVVFTGSPGASDFLRNTKDMDAFLQKPVKPEELLRVLDEKISSRLN